MVFSASLRRMYYAVGLLFFLVGFPAFVHAVTPEAPQLENIIPVHVHTTPLTLERIYRPNKSLPDSGKGLYLKKIKETSIFYKNGLRVGMVIRSIDGRDMDSREQFINHLADSVDSRIRVRYWDPEDGEESTKEFRYHLDQAEVVSYKRGTQYHDPKMEHSPSTHANVSYNSPQMAKVDGKQPCPVCYPGGSSSIWEEIVSRGIGPTNPFVQDMIKSHGEVKPQPEFIKRAFKKLSRHRLRYQMKPRLLILDTREIFASGTPDGFVVVSRGILDYAEGLNQKRLLLAHMFAHMDGRHPPRSVRYQQATKILKEGINRVSEVSIGLDDVGDFLFEAFGMTSQRRWQGLGYFDADEREAHFLKYYYLRKMGVPLDVDMHWETKRRDMIRNLTDNWANHLVMHPTIDIANVKETWKEKIRDQFKPAQTNSEHIPPEY